MRIIVAREPVSGFIWPRIGRNHFGIPGSFIAEEKSFLGIFGIHRFYMGKIFTGLLYLCTAGLFGLGILWDFLTLNEQISDVNSGY